MIEDWLFRNATFYQCDGDCEHCTEKDCEDRLADYKEEEYETF